MGIRSNAITTVALNTARVLAENVLDAVAAAMLARGAYPWDVV